MELNVFRGTGTGTSFGSVTHGKMEVSGLNHPHLETGGSDKVKLRLTKTEVLPRVQGYGSGGRLPSTPETLTLQV